MLRVDEPDAVHARVALLPDVVRAVRHVNEAIGAAARAAVAHADDLPIDLYREEVALGQLLPMRDRRQEDEELRARSRERKI